MAAEFRPPTHVAYFALVCAIAAPLSLSVSRWLGSRAESGDDTFFYFTMAAPVFAVLGLAGALFARGRERNGVVTAALIINTVWLAVIIFSVFGFVVSFAGK